MDYTGRPVKCDQRQARLAAKQLESWCLLDAIIPGSKIWKMRKMQL